MSLYPAVAFDLDGTLINSFVAETSAGRGTDGASPPRCCRSATASPPSAGPRWGNPTGCCRAPVERCFDKHDKARFVEEWCLRGGHPMSQVAAVGDSRTGLPLFCRAELSIALSATGAARRAATHAIEAEDLRDVLGLLR